MKKYTLVGVSFDKMDTRQARKRIGALLSSKGGAAVFTPNSQMLYSASRDQRLRRLLNSADLLLPDGAGISLACRIRGISNTERITGIDTAEWLLRLAERKGLSVYLLGGRAGIARLAARHILRELPKLRIVGTHHGYFDKAPTSKENAAVTEDIRRTAPDIVFVCFGFPAQERWIRENAASLPSVRVFMGLGGALDVWSGNVRRAPRFMQRAGLEWLWRCMLQPRRLRNIAALPLFLMKVKFEY